MARVTLASRFPEIAAEMRPRISAALRMGAEEIASGARLRVPVNTGNLRDSIEVKRGGAGQWKVAAGDQRTFYAAMVEFGTAHAPAHPYMIPAAEAGKDHVEELVSVVLRQL